MANVVDKIYTQVDEIVTNNEYSLYDIEYVKEHGINFLRIYIDTLNDELINLEDCVKISNILNDYFDEHEPFQTEYTIEVASPGIIRKLSKKKHFEQVVGEDIEIKFYKKHEQFESKTIIEKLESVEDEYIVVAENKKINYSDIAKAMTTFEF